MPTIAGAPTAMPKYRSLHAPSADPLPGLTYRVKIVPNAPGHVEAMLEGVTDGSVTFSMAADGRGFDWMANVSEVRAAAAGGTPLPLSQDSAGWHISTQGQATLTFSYTFGVGLVDTRREAIVDRNSLIIQDRAGYFENCAVFAFPDVDVKRIRVVFDVPQGWTVCTSFIPEGNNSYWVEGIPDLRTDLIENYTRMGIAKSVVCETCGDIEIMFVDYENPPSVWQQFWSPRYGTTRDEEIHWQIRRTCELIQYYTALLGSWPGGSRFAMSISTTGGAESGYYCDRGMQVWQRERYPDLVHHVLHAWINPWPHFPIYLDAPEMVYVIKEGPTTFYEHRAASELSGDPKWAGKAYASYQVTRRAAQFGLLGRDTINTYCYAEVRLIALDREIRQATGGAKSLDDLLALLGRRYGVNRQHFTREDLIRAINEVAGADLTAFYSRYMQDRVGDVPDIADVMAQYGDGYLAWIDEYTRPEQWGYAAKGKRTMFFVALEISMTVGEGIEGDHAVIEGSGIFNLTEFGNRLRALKRTVTEADVIDVLSSITGRAEADFFDFYTIGSFRPSVVEINEWLSTPDAQIQIDQPSTAGQPQEGQSAPSTKPQMDLGGAAIKPDGDPSDWGSRQPLATSPSGSNAAQAGADLAAFYAFADDRYLYLRLDQHGGFPQPPLQDLTYSFDIKSREWGRQAYQVSVANSGASTYFLPTEGNTPHHENAQMLQIQAIGQVLEAVVPLDLLDNPREMTIKAYVNPSGGGATIKRLQSCAVPGAAGTTAAEPTSTPRQSRTATTTKPTNTPPVTAAGTVTSVPAATPSGSAQPLPEASSSGFPWAAPIVASVALLIGVALLIAKKKR